MPDIDWDKIRSVDDVILPTGFPETDGVYVTAVDRLDRLPHGATVADAKGNRYLLMGWGSVQGSVILRDRYRRMFHQSGDTRLKYVHPGYRVERQYEGLYHVIDASDGERVARVARFEPGPKVSYQGQTLIPPALARAIARALVGLADEIERG